MPSLLLWRSCHEVTDEVSSPYGPGILRIGAPLTPVTSVQDLRLSNQSAARCSFGRWRRNALYSFSKTLRATPLFAAIPRGLNNGMARHMAAKAAAPDNSFPCSSAWNRANSSAGSIGHNVSCDATSTNRMACCRSRRRINAISRRHNGQPPSNQTVTAFSVMTLTWRMKSSFTSVYADAAGCHSAAIAKRVDCKPSRICAAKASTAGFFRPGL
jgi:hypothetical protein